MEKEEFVVEFPLEQMAALKVAICMWNQADNINVLKRLDDVNPIFPKEVKEKVSFLVLPNMCKTEIMNALEPVCVEMLKWKKYHKSLLSDPGLFFDKLCWTSLGTVDYQKTAETIIKQELVDINISYQLACLYCLDSYIPLIWEKLSEDTKEDFYHRETKAFHDNPNSNRVRQVDLVTIWTYILKGDEAKLYDMINFMGNHRMETNLSVHCHAFIRSVLTGNKVGTEYFYQKLTSLQRRLSLLRTAEVVVLNLSYPSFKDVLRSKYCDVLCYLLSQMDKEKQMELFKKTMSKYLVCFLDWPWQNLFVKIAKVSSQFYDKAMHHSVLTFLSKGRNMCGYYFNELFRELFLLAPSDLKNYSLNQCRKDGWFQALFDTGNTENIKFVLRNAKSSFERQKFLFCKHGLNICTSLVKEGKWSLLELFVRECTLSKKARMELKTIFMEPVWRLRCGNLENWQKLTFLIDNSNEENNSKRDVEDADAEQQPTNKKLKK